MIVRALDSNGDFTFGKGRNNYKKDLKAVSQSISTRLKCFFGDCFFDLSAGIDWFNLLGNNSEAQLKLAVAATILNTEGVSKIAFLNSSITDRRNYLLQYSVITEYGTISDTFQSGVL